MKISVIGKNNDFLADAIVIPVFENNPAPFEWICSEQLTFVRDNAIFSGKEEEMLCLTRMVYGKLQNIILIGLGSAPTEETVMYSVSLAYKKCVEVKARDVITLAEQLPLNLFRTCCETAVICTYKFDKYMTYKQPCSVEEFYFERNCPREDSTIANEAFCRAEATIKARDLINEPPSIMTPGKLAEDIELMMKESSVDVQIIDKAGIEKLGMTAFLQVGKGSISEPKLIIMKYDGDPSTSRRLGLIGKGLTYDSGGYSLQSSEFMETMQHDMSGGAAVAGALWAASELKMPINITAVIAACENKLSATSYVPGDVIPSMSGRFIEVNNTDAEGRITIADAVTYLKTKESVDAIVDIATLTDAIQTALGDRRAGLFSNSREIAGAIMRAGDKSVEPFWELPCDRHIRHVLNSRVAHLKNSAMGSSIGGYATVGAMFVKEFVEDTPWAHLDIGGVAWSRENSYFFHKGGIGFGARMLCDFFREWEAMK